jgi:hypothetical protein
MPSEFRPTSPSDGPELVALAERLLGVQPDSPMFGNAHLHWKYWSEWRGSALARSHVLVRDGRIVAHAGVLPLACRARERTLTLLHPFDWMSEPSAIGSGAALLQRLSRLADGLLIVGGSAMTQRMVRPLGFRALGDVIRYAAPVVPALAKDDLARLTRQEGLSLSPAVPATEQGCEGIPSEEQWLTFLRTPERLDGYRSCPAAPMSVYTVERDAAPLGGFVLALAPGQARIVAHWSATSRPEHHAALIRLARCEAALHAGVDEVATMASHPVEQRAIVAAGFQPVGSVPMFLLASTADVGAEVRVGFQMLDGDVAFLHHGGPQPWL